MKEVMYIIRPAEERDIDDVLALLTRLAEYEDLTGRFTFLDNSAKLKEEFFSVNPDWLCLVSELNGRIVGICTYCFSNINRDFNPTPCLYIDDLFVLEEYRKMGIATSFFDQLRLIAKDNGANRLEWWASDSNDSGKAYYEKLGASRVPVSVYRISL